MRRSLPLIAAAALAACSSQQSSEQTNEVSVATTTNVVSEPAPQASEPLNAAPIENVVPLPEANTIAEPEPLVDANSAAVADVVRSYYALIGQGNYRQAYRLWEPGASGMSVQAFAMSFTRFAEYKADVGAPGPVDAGAGQRFVTVPVRVYGTLKDGGRPFNMRGSVTLHRAADIDGTTPEQRSWRIRSTDIKPRPGEIEPTTPAIPSKITARFRCIDGVGLVARFDNDANTVAIARGGKAVATLVGQPTGSGIHYAGSGYDFRGKGDAMTFTAPGQPPIPCTAIR